MRVTNTGNVRLSCTVNASALTASGSGGSCTGLRVQDCANEQRFNASHTAYISLGNTADVVKIRYYLRDGKYSTTCNAAPQ